MGNVKNKTMMLMDGIMIDEAGQVHITSTYDICYNKLKEWTG